MPSPIELGLAVLTPEFLQNHENLYKLFATGIKWDERIRARKVASFGMPYNYSGTVWPASPVPSFLQELFVMLAEKVQYLPNNCLANFYPTGESTMGFHSDSIEELEPGTGIIIMSLGSPRTMVFRNNVNRSEQHQLILQPGSLFHMSAELQEHWQHAIQAEPDITAGRVSLSFRKLKMNLITQSH
ncbi:MAG: alpha-ketoglutarate-dependent dioxygenase AlkB [Zavarzinella sp.]